MYQRASELVTPLIPAELFDTRGTKERIEGRAHGEQDGRDEEQKRLLGNRARMEARKDQRRQPVEYVIRLGHDLLGPGAHQRHLVVIKRQSIKDDRDKDQGGVGHPEKRQASRNPQALPVQATLRPKTDARLKVESVI